MNLKSATKLVLFSAFLYAFTSQAHAQLQACDFHDVEIMVMSDDLNALNTMSSNCDLTATQNVADENLLFLAARYEAPRVMDQLLKLGVSPHQLNSDSQTPLFFARNLKQVQTLIRSGVELQQLDNWGRSAFSAQLESKRWDILELMLSKGAQIQVRDLQWAADYYHMDALEFLAQNSSDRLLRGTGKYFRTFFFYDKDYRDLAAQLVAKGADLNQARLISSRRSLIDSYVDDYVKNNRHYRKYGSKAIEWLVQNGADVNSYVPRAGKPVAQHLLSRKELSQNLKFLKLFVQHGLELDRVVQGKNILMSLASLSVHDQAEQDYVESMMKEVIALGANLNVQNEQGRSALHWAIRWGNPAAARILIEAGIDLELENEFGQTALEYVRERLQRLSSPVSKRPLVKILKMINS